jgi:DNA polymerase III delta subunit
MSGISLYHGDDTTQSRRALQEELQKLRDMGYTIQTLDGQSATYANLESELLTETLFGQSALVIENMLSRTRGKDRDRCIELILSYTGAKPLLLWEKKEVTKAQLAKFPKTARLTLAKAPARLFQFLDRLAPREYHAFSHLYEEVKTTVPDLLAFTMLARHLALLIQAKSATSLKIPPWQIGKIKAQAAKFDETTLLALHTALVVIDEKVKTGQTKLSYYDHLDILFANKLG